MKLRIELLKSRHRRIDRLIDNCRAATRQEDMKVLKRIRLRLQDEISALQQSVGKAV